MDNTQAATVLSGSAVGESATNAATPNANKDVEIIVAPDVDTKVSTDEAQRKTAVFVTIFYASMFLLVGFILGVWAIVLFSGISGLDASDHPKEMFSMGIVGLGLIAFGIYAVVIAASMQYKNKTEHKLSNVWGVLNWFILNPFSWSLVRQSNGYLSRKQKAKIAKKAAAANSTDSVDTTADAQQNEQAQVTEIN